MKVLVAALILAMLLGCGGNHSLAHNKRVIVLGVDGMDPNFVQRHWSALPNLAKLRDLGGLTRLRTTTPPQSPVAWSTFITGTDPAQHGIFDFVHRDPTTMQPVSSMGETLEPAHKLFVGPWQVPLSKARVRSFRQGQTFWQILTGHGVPVTVIRMPTNYPPVGVGEALSGMGTPDLQGTFGTFTYYTESESESDRDVPGGRIVHVADSDDRVVLPIQGPANTLRRDHRTPVLDLTVDIDPDQPVARFHIADERFILRQGEWSPWIRIRFAMIPYLAHVSAMFRMYVAELHPAIRIYRSALNVDPANPALPISTPANYSRQIASRVGPFYTQGIEEDTSALRQGALNLPEYLEQVRLVSLEHAALLNDSLTHFGQGLLFFYFSEIDQNSHMLWGRHEAELLNTYQTVDRDIGRVLTRAKNTTVVVMSDHGFAPFQRSVNLNTWLWHHGFLELDGSPDANGNEMFAHVNWHETRAYAMGLNSLYINLAGREKQGIVQPGRERALVIADLIRQLRAFRDPETGRTVIADVSAIERSNSRFAPDLIVGYAPGYRASWETALGGLPANLIEENVDAWIGDHCIAASAVPGVLLGNRKPHVQDPELKDLTVTILKEFGVPPDSSMTGRPVY